jgi:hypothetical protein
MAKSVSTSIIPVEKIEKVIYLIRGHKVILDRDLADLYDVETRVLNQAVRRNIDRFPIDFMFQLSKSEFDNLKSQIVISSWGGIRKMPLAFTEQGVAMLSGVLNSKRAIQVNVEIMRAFVRLRQIISTYKDLEEKIRKLEKKYDKQFQIVFEAIRELISPKQPPKEYKIGFRPTKQK